MTSYTATIRLYAGFSTWLNPVTVPPSYEWTIAHGDIPSEADPTNVLDALTLGWSFPEGDLYPTQPDADRATIRLLVDDASGIADMTAAYVKITSGGVTIAEWAGRIVQPTAVPVRRKVAGVMVRRMLVTIPVRDLILDLADTKLDLARPAETLNNRYLAVRDAILNSPDCPEWLSAVNLPDTLSTTPLDVLNAKGASAYDLLNDVLRQDSLAGRSILRVYDDALSPASHIGPFRVRPQLLDAPSHGVYPPGVLALTAHQLGVTFDGASPAPAGLELPAGRITEDSFTFTSLRAQAVNRVRVTGPFAGSPFQLTNGLPEGRTVDVATDYTQTDDSGGHLTALAHQLLPQPLDGGFRWSLDGFTWRPTDAQLAALDYPLMPVNFAYSAATIPPYVMYGAAAITGLVAALNPGSDDPFYGGQLSALTLSIIRGELIVTGKIARRLPGFAGGAYCVTHADIKASWPTVATKTGTDVLSPTMSSFDLKLARKM